MNTDNPRQHGKGLTGSLSQCWRYRVPPYDTAAAVEAICEAYEEVRAKEEVDMLMVILACYTEFEKRVGMIEAKGVKSTAYDIVKKYTEQVLGTFTSRDVLISCPGIGRTAVHDSLKQLVTEGIIIRHGAGRSTYYVRTDADT